MLTTLPKRSDSTGVFPWQCQGAGPLAVPPPPWSARRALRSASIMRVPAPGAEHVVPNARNRRFAWATRRLRVFWSFLTGLEMAENQFQAMNWDRSPGEVKTACLRKEVRVMENQPVSPVERSPPGRVGGLESGLSDEALSSSCRKVPFRQLTPIA